MTTGVHDTGNSRAIIRFMGFLNRQRVDIGSERYDAACTLAAFQNSQNAGISHTGVGNSNAVQFFFDPQYGIPATQAPDIGETLGEEQSDTPVPSGLPV